MPPRPKVSRKPQSPKFAPRRNAAAPALPRPPRPPKTAEVAPPLTAGKHLLLTAGGAIGASAIGALAARWGVAPDFLATVITVGAGGLAWKHTNRTVQTVASDAASAGGSQLMLMNFGPALTPKPTTVVIANQNQAPPRLKNADLGELPSGMLHSAFERARAELSIADQPHDLHDHADVPRHAA
jgi:hypothetical protein